MALNCNCMSDHGGSCDLHPSLIMTLLSSLKSLVPDCVEFVYREPLEWLAVHPSNMAWI